MAARTQQGLRGWRGAIANLWYREDAVAAVEFGLIAPMLFFSFLPMADIGLAVFDRMTMDHVLRVGAQHATLDPGNAQVLNTITSAARSHFGACSSSANSLCATVTSECVCPGGGSTPNCTAAPNACVATFQKFYTISGTMRRDAMFLPDFTFNTTLRVQIR
jgi:pilus assembly protein CpaE